MNNFAAKLSNFFEIVIFLEKVTNPECKNMVGYNLSLFHGISSIILFLSRMINSGMKDKRVIDKQMQGYAMEAPGLP